MSHSRLTLRRITRVALVDAGANRDEETGEGAHILLAKRDGPALSPRQRLHEAMLAGQGMASEEADQQDQGRMAAMTSTATKQDLFDEISKRAVGANPSLAQPEAIDAYIQTDEGRAAYAEYVAAPDAPPVAKAEPRPMPGQSIAAGIDALADAIVERSGGAVSKYDALESVLKSAQGERLQQGYDLIRRQAGGR
jgi:hypothetical protein